MFRSLSGLTLNSSMSTYVLMEESFFGKVSKRGERSAIEIPKEHLKSFPGGSFVVVRRIEPSEVENA